MKPLTLRVITSMWDAGLSQGYDVTVGGFIIEVGG